MTLHDALAMAVWLSWPLFAISVAAAAHEFYVHRRDIRIEREQIANIQARNNALRDSISLRNRYGPWDLHEPPQDHDIQGSG